MRKKRGRIVVTSADEIRALAKGINILSTGKVRPVEVNISQLNDVDNRRIGEELQNLYSACGCEQGRISGAFALVAYLFLIITGIVPMEEIGMQKTMIYFVIFAAFAMLIGKLYGISKGRKAILELANKVDKL